MLCLWLKWLKFRRWWNRLWADVNANRTIDWPARINELLVIINEALDANGTPKSPVKPLPTPDSIPSEPTKPSTPVDYDLRVNAPAEVDYDLTVKTHVQVEPTRVRRVGLIQKLFPRLFGR